LIPPRVLAATALGLFIHTTGPHANVVSTVRSQSADAGQTRTPRGLWVWETPPLLHDPSARRAFFEFCAHHDIGIVGIQIATQGRGVDRRLTDATEWKTLIADAHRRGMRIHALDGDPAYARRAEHATVLSIVDAVIAYNAAAAASERFYGIHLDIEPYLLAEWTDPHSRERLLAEYLDLNERAAQRARAAGIVYGVDVPFWWRSVDTATGQPVSATTFHGVRKSATEHVLGIVDNVGIMAYRNVAAGPDGIVADALATLDAADRIGSAKAFVGVEVDTVSDGVPAKATFAGKTLRELHDQLTAVDTVFVGRPAYAGIAIHRYAAYRQLLDK
jgi:hypothetical protein